MNPKNLIKPAVDILEKHAPTIMTGLAVTSSIAGFGSAIYETVEAVKEWDSEADIKAKVKLIFSHYAIPAGFEAAAVAFAIAANKTHIARYAALAAAYAATDGRFKEYKDAVLKTVGEKKEEDIRTTQAQQSVNTNPPSQQIMIVDGNGTILCQDGRSKRYFQSSKNKIDAAINEINKMIALEGRMTLNDFYDELGLDGTSEGEVVGWDLQQYSEVLDVHFSFAGDPNGNPCLVLDYEVYRLPRWDE